MNVIIVAKFLRGPRNFALRDPKVIAATSIALVAIVLSGFLIGFFARGLNGPAHAQLAAMQARLDEQNAALLDVRAGSSRELNAMAARLGELQAQANRLNALGERLTRSGKLGDGEFNFIEAPGVGGIDPATPQSAFDVQSRLNELELQFESSGEQLSLIEALLADQDVDLSATPAGMPVKGGYMSSHFGNRTDPITGGNQFHRGLDFSGKLGDPITAVADGVVIFASRDAGLGNLVEIDHGNGLMTRYGHNSKLLVSVGERVRAGDKISLMGSTGRSTGNHLHFEVWRDGRPVNPRQFLQHSRG
jgi:murein DD-endopeptidase MepM/ murein hydrolase activator NlpD